MLEFVSSAAGEAYLSRHGVKDVVKELLEELTRGMPDDPFAAMIAKLTLVRESNEHLETCPNAWCEMRVPRAELESHAKMCRPDRWTKCIRCETRVETSRMQQHRMNCNLVACPQCGEYVFPRMLSLCPLGLLKSKSARRSKEDSGSGLVSSQSISKSPTVGSEDAALRSLQGLWRKSRARTAFGNFAFQAIWHLMESAREQKVARGMSTPLTRGGASFEAGAALQVSSPLFKGSAAFPRKHSLEYSQPLLAAEVEVITQDYTDTFRQSIFQMIGARDVIEYPIAIKIIGDASKLLARRPVVVHVESPTDGEVVVVGDIHGQLKDLMHIIAVQGLPSSKKYYVFNGDFVDRGPYGVEVLLCVYTLLCSFPQYVFLNRGNHEDAKTNAEYGFVEEIQSKYDDNAAEVIDAVTRSFKFLPLVTVIDKRVMVVHGGLSRHVVTLERISLLGKVKHVPTVEQADEDDEILCDLLWSDPVEHYKSRQLGTRHQGEHWRSSARGCGVEYLEPLTEAFLSLNGLELIIRSHEMVAGGYEVCHAGRCVTVFSGSDYCGVSGNRGAIAILSSSADPVYHTWFIKQDVVAELDLESSYNHFSSDSGMVGVDENTLLAGFDEGMLISFDEAAAQSGQPNHSSVQADCIQQIRELAWVKRYDLMSTFCAADVEQTGAVSKVEWCEVVKKVLCLPDLPWYFLCPFVAQVTTFREIPSIRYAQFVASFDTECGKAFETEWILYTIRTVFKSMELPDDLQPASKEHERLLRRRQSSICEEDALPRSQSGAGGAVRAPQPPKVASPHRGFFSARIAKMSDAGDDAFPQLQKRQSKVGFASPSRKDGDDNRSYDSSHTRAPDELSSDDESDAFPKKTSSVSSLYQAKAKAAPFRFNFNYFVAVLRAKSPAAAQLEDSDLYVLFRHFDQDNDGHVLLPELQERVEEALHSSSSNCETSLCSGSELLVTSLQDAKTSLGETPFKIARAEQEQAERWLYPALMMLQRFFLYDRHRDLKLMFRYMDRDHDGVVNFDDFCRAVQKMNRIISHEIEEQQMKVMFGAILVNASQDTFIDVETFVQYFRVAPVCCTDTLSSTLWCSQSATAATPSPQLQSLTPEKTPQPHDTDFTSMLSLGSVGEQRAS